jgi:HK97 family phage major capsid protein
MRALGKVETRTNMNRTPGTGGEFVPPLWLINKYVPLARAGRVSADLCNKMPLPEGTNSINIPKVLAGTTVAEQTSDGATISNTDATTTSVSAAVTTLAGQQRFAMQLLDQSPINFDEVVFGDLIAALATVVDVYVLTKTAIGILNVTGINAVTFTQASPTVPLLYPKVADGIQQIHTGRFMPPQAIVMHPRRWAWHLAALDSSNRPLVVPSAQGPQNAFAGMEDVRSQGSVGILQGLAVYVDPSIPINLGAGTNEDRVIEARFDDLYLWEGQMRTRILFETDADTLQVRLQVWEYAAFLGSRYPKAISVVAGTGLVTPTF